MTSFPSTIVRSGDDLFVVIPDALAEELHLKLGDEIDVSAASDCKTIVLSWPNQPESDDTGDQV